MYSLSELNQKLSQNPIETIYMSEQFFVELAYDKLTYLVAAAEDCRTK